MKQNIQDGIVLLEIIQAVKDLGVFFRIRVDASLEILALRQQVAVLKRKRTRPYFEADRSPVLDHPPTDLASMV
jgi:hypothetical protein